MRAVIRRELYSLYATPQGYVFSGAFVLVMNIFFYFANVGGQDSDLGAAFSFMLNVLMFTVPVLTMRMFAEEYRRGTDRLIFTAPISLKNIVLGKFWAAMIAFAATLSVTLIWAEIIALFGALNLTEYIGQLASILIFAAVYVSIGLLVSALTESQMVSMLSTLGAFAALLLLDVAGSMLPDSIFARFINSFSIFRRYDTFSRGVFSLVDLVFIATFCIFFLFMTTLVLHRRRHGFKGQRLRLLALTIPAIAVLVAANLLCNALESRLYLKFDMTRAQLFSLSSQTVTLLRELPEQVTITMLSRPEEVTGVVVDDETGVYYQLSDVREYLDKYMANANDNLTFQYVDPYLNPGWVRERDPTQQTGMFSIVVESDRRTRILSVRDLYETEVQDYDGENVYEAVVGLNAERVLTSSILNVITEKLPKAVVLTGHGEYKAEYFREILSQCNYAVEEVNLSGGAIPSDTSLVLLAAPVYDFSERELDILDKYLSGGGSAIVALDPTMPELPALDLYLTEWGVSFERAYVCDAELNYGREDLLLPVLELNRYTEALDPNGRYVLVAGAGVINMLWSYDGNRAAAPILSTYDMAYAKPLDVDNPIEDLAKSAGDLQGPFVLGAVSEQVKADGTGSIVAFLPVSMLADEALSLPNFLNRQILIHLLSQTQQDLIIDIPPRDITPMPLAVNSQEALVLLIVLVGVIPLGVFGTGVAVWFRRRRL